MYIEHLKWNLCPRKNQQTISILKINNSLLLLEKLNLKELTIEALVSNGLVGKNDLVKILGRGELKSKIQVSAHAFSASAKLAIESAGGNAVVVEKRWISLFLP